MMLNTQHKVIMQIPVDDDIIYLLIICLGYARMRRSVENDVVLRNNTS